MTIVELREIAEQHGIYTTPFIVNSERRLIWAIQKARGDECCFQTTRRIHCLEAKCEWHSACFQLIAEWRR